METILNGTATLHIVSFVKEVLQLAVVKTTLITYIKSNYLSQFTSNHKSET